MKKKVGTVLNEELFIRAKQSAISHKKSLSRLLEDALEMYLSARERKNASVGRNISRTTHGSMRIAPNELKSIMEEANVYETD
ncbi:MAG: hypothetical protein FJ088_01340 [Deltaproteobacteria bacterium]|nr:hypothetical protein [Deltaproteobacteria bacterium]